MADEIATQVRDLPLYATTETCSGRTYIVTGANIGLGLEASKHLVNFGAAKVIMAVRNMIAGEAARDTIIKETGKSADVAEVWELDLSVYESVKAFAKKALAELPRIDAIIENAGVAHGAAKSEGHALTMTVNVYSTFLLGALLFPRLKESAQKYEITPYLTIVSSGAAFSHLTNWDEFKDDPLVKGDAENVGMMVYPLSKLIEIFFVRELANSVPVSRTGVVVNYLSPGLCITQLARNASPEFKTILQQQHAQYGRTAEEGSRTLLHAILAGKESHGTYLSSCEIAENKLPSWVTDADGQRVQRQIFDGIVKELESISPGSTKEFCVGKD